MKSTFRCKFDEHLLGMVNVVIQHDPFKEKFEEYFADDIKMEGIRGKCDKDVVAAASVAGVDRTIITNDKDFLFGVKNKMGVIVLWGGVGAEGSFQSFRSLKRKEKIKAIIVLFERYLSDMERVRNNGDRLLAVLSCQANDGTGDLTWEFKPPGDDMKIRYLLKKEAEATKAQNHN